MKFKVSWKYVFLVIILYVGVFWSWIQYSLVSFFGYWDELYAILYGIFLLKIVLDKGIIAKKEDFLIFILLIGYCIFCFLGNICTRYAGISAILKDFSLNIKFFMSLYFTIWIMRSIDIQEYKTNIMKHAYIITCIFVVLFVIDKIFKVFPVYENRFGIDSEQLIFAHPTFTAAALFFLTMVYILFGNLKNKLDLLGIGILCGLIVMTLRFKAIASVFLFVAVLVLFMFFKIKKINIALIISAGLAVFAICYEQIYFYFFSPVALQMPRGAILNTSIQIARDYFPLGTGFGTFASYSSGVMYSPVYSLYGIDNIYGMTYDNYNAITDNYWPMILGQSGIIGFLCMFCIWLILYKKIDIYKNINLQLYLAGMGSFIYMLISSTSESAIVNPVCIPLAFILGICFAQESIMEKDLV